MKIDPAISLTLADAVRAGRLSEFVAQEEARGVGPIDLTDFDSAAAALIKAPRSKSRTSRSSSDDGSNGTKIRPDSGPYTSD